MAWAPMPGLASASRLRLPASPGAAADILRRTGGGERIASAAGKWWPGSRQLADRSGLCLRRAFLRGPLPDASSGDVGLVPASPVSFIPALGRVPNTISVCFSSSLPAYSAEASLSGSYLTTSRNHPSAVCLIPLLRRRFSLFVCFFPPL